MDMDDIEVIIMIIHVLPALSGDSFIIDFENGKCCLIDGGYKSTFLILKEKLSSLCVEGKRLEYIILTHYDRDHIAGLIELMKENGKKGNETIIPVDHIIYNDFSYLYNQVPLLGEESCHEISFDQLKTFEYLCHENGMGDTADPIVTGQVFDGLGYQLRIISPTVEDLDKCKDYEIRQEYRDSPTPILGKLCRDLSDWKDLVKGSELNVINKASLAFDITFGQKKLLFCGDAEMNDHKELLFPKYDIIKLSHHGTFYGNECFCSDSAVIADHYIVSTNGSRIEHPNRRLLSDLLRLPHQKYLYLNYDISHIEHGKYYLLFQKEQQIKYRFKTIITNTIIL